MARTPTKQDPHVDSQQDVPVITVVGPQKGRRRAGRQFGAEPVQIPVTELGDDPRKAIAAIEALKSDPLLIVSIPAELQAELDKLAD